MNFENWLSVSHIAIFIGTALVGFGGFGQYYFNRRIEQIKDNELKSNTQKLNEKISTLLEGNKSLQEQLKPFETLAEHVYPGIEKELALEKLKSDYYKLEKKTNQIEEKIKDRYLNSSQQAFVIESLKKLEKGGIIINSVFGDQEAFQFAQQFKEIFQSAGWLVDGVNQSVFTVPFEGLIISISSEPPPMEANSINHLLQSLGFKVTGNIDKSQQPGSVALIVGKKQ